MTRVLGALALTLLLGGCATLPSGPRASLEQATAVELTAVPFHPQQEYQCGPAALATVLNWSGIDIAPDELTASLYIPARRGTLQPELLAQARRNGRLAYPLAPELAAMLSELEAGHPVLVLQNLGLARLPFWHYAVVVGYDPTDEHFVLRSGPHERHRTAAATFYRTWQRGGQWAVVVVEPGTVPASAEPSAYLAAAFALEQSGRTDEAVHAYAAGTRRWPKNAALALAHGNAHYGAGRPAAAAGTYRAALERGADSPLLHNNLANALAALGEWEAAEAAARRATAAGGPHEAHFHRTLARIRCRGDARC
jgi:tetratricopeptide (TPR) repeat protein